MDRISRILGGFVAVAAVQLSVGLRGVEAAEPLDLGASVTLTSDYVFRGISQTMQHPALQGGVDAAHASGFYGWLWGSSVEFVPDGDPDDGAELEIDAGLGYAFELGEHLGVDLAVVRYVFPGTEPGVDYDYTEWLGTLSLADRLSVTLGYSADVFASGDDGYFYELRGFHELPAGLSLQAAVGHYDLHSAFAVDYGYVDAGLSRSFERTTVMLSYHRAFGDTAQMFYDGVSGERLALAVELAW